MKRIGDTHVLLASALAALAIPPLVFMAVALASGMSLIETGSALTAQYVTSRVNLTVCSGLGLAPLVVLAGILWVGRRWRKTGDTAAYAIGGALPILAVILFVNLEYWTAFLPNRTFLGFPHGLEFIIGPGVFAPIGMLIGLAVAGAVTRMQP